MTAASDRPESEIERRKREHVELAAGAGMTPHGGAGWSDIQLLHEALPEVSRGSIDTSVDFLGTRLRMPLVIASMTGGFDDAARINAILAGAAERHGLAMGVGSQRAALAQPELARTYSAARDAAPNAFLVANIGIAQLVDQPAAPRLRHAEVEALCAMIEANALAIHLNAAQELVQAEGQPDAEGWLSAIQAVASHLSLPVIAKETGSGMSSSTARRLREAGAVALDVGGRGGTSFVAIEALRAQLHGEIEAMRLGEMLATWGIPTAVSVMLAGRAELPVVATGGVRTGLDAAKAVTLGATAVGVARPMLQAALAGEGAVDDWIERFRSELIAVMFLTGSRDLATLRRAPRIVTGEIREWMEQLEDGADG